MPDPAEAVCLMHSHLVAAGVRDPRVLAAMTSVPREHFVPQALRGAAYADSPLPIGCGQTISQPLMVAILLEALELDGSERVLDVGTGSGYQAALLAELAREVYSIELLPELAERARTNIAVLGYRDVVVVVGDGSQGYPPAAPYDAIAVAAGAPDVPGPLIEQLAPGGRLLIPVGGGLFQRLLRIRRQPEGTTTEDLGGCAFVPLIGVHGWNSEARVG